MKPQEHYCLEDIVTRVNGGDYIPIGETRYDDEAYERQKIIENLIDYLVDGLSQICQKNAVEYSIQQASKEAKRYLRRLSDDISDMLDEVNGY